MRKAIGDGTFESARSFQELLMNVDVLLFDIGGTVFDWRSAIIESLQSVKSKAAREFDKETFSATWRQQSLIEVEQIADSRADWRPFDTVLQSSLTHTLIKSGNIEIMPDDRGLLIRAWENMPAWPEARDALARIRRKYYIAPFTILSLRVASFSSRNAEIVWDAVISCDSLKAMKPSHESYQRALDLLGRKPEKVGFVASHPSDLRAAGSQGMKTAYVVAKLHDYGDDYVDKGYSEEFDLVANDFTDLADKLSC